MNFWFASVLYDLHLFKRLDWNRSGNHGGAHHLAHWEGSTDRLGEGLTLGLYYLYRPRSGRRLEGCTVSPCGLAHGAFVQELMQLLLLHGQALARLDVHFAHVLALGRVVGVCIGILNTHDSSRGGLGVQVVNPVLNSTRRQLGWDLVSLVLARVW